MCLHTSHSSFPVAMAYLGAMNLPDPNLLVARGREREGEGKKKEQEEEKRGRGSKRPNFFQIIIYKIFFLGRRGGEGEE